MGHPVQYRQSSDSPHISLERVAPSNQHTAMSQDARGTPSNTLSGPVVLGAVALTGAALGLGWYLTHRGQLQYWGLERHTRKSGWEQGEAGGIGSGRFPRNPAPGLGAVCGGISVHPSSYPWGRREEECADLVHGAYVPDPYRSVPRWM